MKRMVILFTGVMFLLAGIAVGQQVNPLGGKKPDKKRKVYDIAVTDILTDSSCYLQVAYKNLGTKNINTTLRIKVWVDGVLVKDENKLFDLFNVGAERTHTFSSWADPVIISGTSVVKASVDTTGLLAESDEANNTRKEKISCRSTFDIAVTDLYVDNDCVLWVKFKNNGTAMINTKLHFKLWINGVLTRDKDMLFDFFNAGTTRSHGYTGAAPIKILAPSVVKASVDTTNKLTETNELNNHYKERLTCKRTIK